MADYRATGAQREIPPWTKGVTMADWLAKQPLCDGASEQKRLQEVLVDIDKKIEEARRKLAEACGPTIGTPK